MCDTCRKNNVMPLHGNQRAKLKGINPSFHCSIIGTCLSMSELRKVARKIGAEFEEGMSDYNIHSAFVNLITSHDLSSKLLNKLLDRKYARYISKVRVFHKEEELLTYWQQSLESGDIPGPYWAVMSHADVSEHCRSVLFGDVHMLSHMVGAANRADIKRLQVLEADHEQLLETQRRDKKQYQNQMVDRDFEITKLRDLVTRGEMARSKIKGTERRLQQYENGSMVASLSAQISHLQCELDKKVIVQERNVEAAKTARSELAAVQNIHGNMMEEFNEALAERRALERLLEQGLGELCNNCELADNKNSGPAFDLGGATILYVGGRPSQVHHMRELAEQAGGSFVHHDGGIEDNDHRLTQLLSRGDVVMCPIDCVSHNACLRAKKFCRNQGKNFVPLRSSGLSSFVAGLQQVS